MAKSKKIHPTTQYALDIVSGKISANKWTRLTCKRHLDDLKEGEKRGLYFDESAANHIIMFFEEFLVFYEGEFDGKPFLLTPHQKFILGSIFGWKKKPDGYRRFKTVYIEEAKGNGKALSVDTPISTPNGWTTMGEIQIGDQVFDEERKITTVIAVTPIMEDRECYCLKFSDNAEIIADADHLWKTHTQITEDELKTTREIFETLMAGHRIDDPLSQNWMITSCDRIDSVPVRCIQVNAPSGMFLAGKEMIPTHNSPLAAGVGLYGLCFDDEPGSEIYSCATTREQAGILFRDARTFAEKSPSLKELLRIDKYNIANERENGFFRPISSEHRGLDGKRPHIALIDEIHEHPNDLVVRKMSAGAKGRRQNLTFEITNSGYDRNSICYQHHDYTKKILEVIVQNDEWFGMISGLDVCSRCESEGKTVPQDGCPDCDDWRDEKNFIKANPNLEYLGKPFRDYLRRQVEEAKAMPSQENIVKRLNFNIWTKSITKWISADIWNACTFSVDFEKLKHRVCYGGLDLSSNTDLSAWVLVFPPIEEDGKYEVLCRFFLPEDNMRERVYHDKVPYDVWVRQGYIITTPGNIIDYTFILDQINKDMTDYEIKELAFDRWGSQKITTDLQDLGFEIEGKGNLVQFGQGFASMSAPTKELEKMVLAKEIAHGGNPVLSWMMSNIAIREDPAGNKKPDKEKSTEHIDGIVALIMAIGRAMLRKGPEKSIYDDLSYEQIKSRMAL